MASTCKIQVENGDPIAAVRNLMAAMLREKVVDAVFTARQTPGDGVAMPALIADPEQMSLANPLTPSFPLNAARMLARLTKGEGEGAIAAVMRPCEVRSFVELVKLNQGSAQDLILVGVDCFGAYNNHDAREVQAGGMEATRDFLATQGVLPGHTPSGEVPSVSRACKACEYPVADAADLHIGLAGLNIGESMVLVANTANGEGVLNQLGLADVADSGARDKAVEELVGKRVAYRDAMFEEVAEATNTPQKLSEYLAGCVNCYNCRVACPACYCKECVFVTDVFDHKPWQYFGWARRAGSLRLPTDTEFFHITRLAHMSVSCVGCGQCSNACPNEIPVMELFRAVSARTQKAFDYEPGRDMAEPLPLSVFYEKEFDGVAQEAP